MFSLRVVMKSPVKVFWGVVVLFALPTAVLALVPASTLGPASVIVAIYLWSILLLFILLPARPPRLLQRASAALFAVALLD